MEYPEYNGHDNKQVNIDPPLELENPIKPCNFDKHMDININPNPMNYKPIPTNHNLIHIIFYFDIPRNIHPHEN